MAILALSAMALAEPEADAQFFYGNPYGGLDHLSPGLVAYSNGAVVPADTLSVQVHMVFAKIGSKSVRICKWICAKTFWVKNW